jgi:hypothetical protein
MEDKANPIIMSRRARKIVIARRPGFARADEAIPFMSGIASLRSQ